MTRRQSGLPIARIARLAGAPIRGLAFLARRSMSALKNRRAVAELLKLEDHMLRDIGVTRQDVESALAEPLFRDASWRLAERTFEARRAERTRATDALRWARLMQAAADTAPPDDNEGAGSLPRFNPPGSRAA